jgi:glutamate racemase
MSQAHCPIGVFDSGVGGLTVLGALVEALPHEDFIYLGDTARLPYGTRSAAIVRQYVHQAARRLVAEDIKMLVVACNTASALALPSLRVAWPDLPMQGVIEPGAEAAVEATQTGRIAVLATAGTVRAKAYVDAIQTRLPAAVVAQSPASLLVALVEEGWTDGLEAEAILARYLAQMPIGDYDTLVLGCTHFPLLRPVFRRLLPASVALVDSAAATARAVVRDLNRRGLARQKGAAKGAVRFGVTDAPDRFRTVAGAFLGDKVPCEQIETIVLDASEHLGPSGVKALRIVPNPPYEKENEGKPDGRAAKPAAF